MYNYNYNIIFYLLLVTCIKSEINISILLGTSKAGDLVGSVGQEGPLQEEMAAHSSILAGNPGDRGACGLQSLGSQIT